MTTRNTVLGGALSLFWAALAAPAAAQSPFDGTWRPDPQRPEPGHKPDVIEVKDGEYECKTCSPPYRVKADGADHAVSGNPRFDTLSVKVLDEQTVSKTAKRAGKTLAESKSSVSADGRTLSDRQILSDAGPHPIDFTSISSRVAAGAPGSHRVSGTWQMVEADLTHHDEDTTYKLSGDTVSMSDHMGRSFTAKLDGSDAPYKGDPEFSSVSVRLLDPRTLEESDKSGGQVVKITRWSIEADGRTMHARFDDRQGHVMEQTGHKLP